MKPFALLVSLFLLISIIEACEPNDCGSFKPVYWDIINLEGSLVTFTSEDYFPNQEVSAADTISVPYTDVGIWIDPVATTFNSVISSINKHGSWLNAAYACSPPPPEPSEQIADITIVSDNDYVQANSSKVIEAGDTLNTVFEIYDLYSGRIVGLPDFLLDEDLMATDDGFFLRPAVAVAEPQQHTFTVRYRLTNREVYEYHTAPITITP